MTDIDCGFTPTNPERAPKITWETRRMMSWVLLVGIIVGTVLAGAVWMLCDLSNQQLDFIESVHFYFVVAASSVILGYFGLTTLPFVGLGRK